MIHIKQFVHNHFISSRIFEKMSLYTVASRLVDGLPLFASTDAGGHETEMMQAKELIKRIDASSPSKMTLDSGPYSLSYMVEDSIVFLAAAERGYPRKLVFSYLAEVHRAFAEQLQTEFGPTWRQQVGTIAKPYAFLKFERHLQRLRREYADPSSKSNTAKLSEELSDIHSIMQRNIREVLDRGEKLEHVSRVSSKLLSDSKQFKWGAKKLNLMDRWRKALPFVIVGFIVLLLLWWRFW